MNDERFESDWSGKRGVECRLMCDQKVVYRGEEMTGAVFLRGHDVPASARKEPIQIIVDLRKGTPPKWMTDDFDVALASCWHRRIPPLISAEERAFPFRLTIPSETLAQPAYLVARVHSVRWPYRRKARAILSVRIGPPRTVEEVIFDLAELSEARIQSWGTTGTGDRFRARLKPLRRDARYRAVSVEFVLINGRAQGRVHVMEASTDIVHAYEVDLRLADRVEYRQAMWRCLQRHLDLSGQFPIPALASSPMVDQLPRPVDNLSPSFLDEPG